MSESTPFFQEVRKSLMVRGDGWKPVIEDLPNHINVKEVIELLQSASQLTVLTGQGHIAGSLITTKLDAAAVAPFLNNEKLTLENLTLQWLYRFIITEGLCEHARKEPLGDWPRMFLHMIEQGLHFMLYISALMVLIEEKKISYQDSVLEGGEIRYEVSRDLLVKTETVVKNRIKEACEFLHPKAQDYGESFRRHGIPGLLPRLWDKIARYAQLKADNRTGNFEKLEDSARDLLGYCCIAYSLMLELPKELRESYQPTSIYETESNTYAGAEWKKIK
jgi:hypothetical protein